MPAAWGVTCVTARPQLLLFSSASTVIQVVGILQLSHSGTGVGDSSGFPGIGACVERIHPAFLSRARLWGKEVFETIS